MTDPIEKARELLASNHPPLFMPSHVAKLVEEVDRLRGLESAAIEMTAAYPAVAGTDSATLGEWERFHRAGHAVWLALGRPDVATLEGAKAPCTCGEPEATGVVHCHHGEPCYVDDRTF